MPLQSLYYSKVCSNDLVLAGNSVDFMQVF